MSRRSKREAKLLKAWRAGVIKIVEAAEPGFMKKHPRISDKELQEVLSDHLEKFIETKREKAIPDTDELPF